MLLIPCMGSSQFPWIHTSLNVTLPHREISISELECTHISMWPLNHYTIHLAIFMYLCYIATLYIHSEILYMMICKYIMSMKFYLFPVHFHSHLFSCFCLYLRFWMFFHHKNDKIILLFIWIHKYSSISMRWCFFLFIFKFMNRYTIYDK